MHTRRCAKVCLRSTAWSLLPYRHCPIITKICFTQLPMANQTGADRIQTISNGARSSIWTRSVVAWLVQLDKHIFSIFIRSKVFHGRRFWDDQESFQWHILGEECPNRFAFSKGAHRLSWLPTTQITSDPHRRCSTHPSFRDSLLFGAYRSPIQVTKRTQRVYYDGTSGGKHKKKSISYSK